jgi:hypothetical protein
MSSSTDIILEGETGGRDENRVCSVTVPYLAKSLGDVLTVGGKEYQGLRETSRAWQAFNDGSGGYIVTVEYKGYSNDDPSPEPEETEQWSIDFDFSEESLESHPKWQEIKKKYGGYQEEAGGPVKFPETMPDGGGKSGGLGGRKLKTGDKNPMFGAKTYAVMTARATRTWSSRRIPKNAVNDIGKVYQNIPGAPHEFDQIEFGDRNWMAMPPKISQNGDVWRIQNEWMLSPPGGWVEEVYEKDSKR